MPSDAGGASSSLVASAAPLDFSFKELKACAELETEEPRSGAKRKPPDAHGQGLPPAASAIAAVAPGTAGPGTGGGASGPGGLGATTGASAALAKGATGSADVSQIRAVSTPHMKRVVRKVNVAVKLNNNSIETLQDLPQSLEFVMEDPLRNLQWVDLSFNQLNTIDPALLQFQQLKALYLHGNLIRTLPSVERLRKLPKLISLTLNGNPIECSKVYRVYIVGALQSLRALDHSTITEDELQSAGAWFKAHLKRAEERRKNLEDAALAMNE